MKKCIAIVLSLSITFGYCTSTVFGDKPPKKQNKNTDILPKPDIKLACSILGPLGFIGFLKYLYKKFNKPKIIRSVTPKAEPLIPNTSSNVQPVHDTLETDAHGNHAFDLGGNITHDFSLSERREQQAVEAEPVHHENPEFGSGENRAQNPATPGELLALNKLRWQWLLCTSQINKFFDSSIDIPALKNMFINCMAIIFDFENNKKIVCESTDKININNYPNVILDIIIEIKYSTETNLDAYRNMCISKLKPILIEYFGAKHENQAYRTENQINHMIQFVEKDTATNYFEKCEIWEEPLRYERQKGTPVYIRTGLLTEYRFTLPIKSDIQPQATTEENLKAFYSRLHQQYGNKN
ncbi:MAG: hypothetical protein IJC57_03675 [Clostridia bacterium]|nr:hypothetical protein [Clostridia bacterium]